MRSFRKAGAPTGGAAGAWIADIAGAAGGAGTAGAPAARIFVTPLTPTEAASEEPTAGITGALTARVTVAPLDHAARVALEVVLAMMTRGAAREIVGARL